MAGSAFWAVQKFNIHSSLFDSFGIARNGLRESKDIPNINKSWKVHWQDSTYVYWSSKSNIVDRNEPYHQSKTLNFINQSLTSEEDIFHFENDGKTAYELTAITDSGYSKVEFELTVFYRKNYPPNESRKVQYSVGDSILKAWGFNSYYKIQGNTTPVNAPENR